MQCSALRKEQEEVQACLGMYNWEIAHFYDHLKNIEIQRIVGERMYDIMMIV